MNLLKGLGLVGIGYFLSNKYTLTKVHTYKPYNPNRISYSDYFHELVINKLDILFYGGEVHSNRRNRANYYDHRPTYRYKPQVQYDGRISSDDLNKLLTFDSRDAARIILHDLQEFAKTYGFVTVADLCDLRPDAMVHNKFTFNKFGWFESDIEFLTPGRDIIPLGDDERWELSLPAYRSLD